MKRLRLWNSMLLCVLLGVAILCSHQASASAEQVAQQPAGGSLVGRVIDEKGEPVIGATVVVEGTTTGALTDIDGAFTLKAKGGGI